MVTVYGLGCGKDMIIYLDDISEAKLILQALDSFKNMHYDRIDDFTNVLPLVHKKDQLQERIRRSEEAIPAIDKIVRIIKEHIECS